MSNLISRIVLSVIVMVVVGLLLVGLLGPFLLSVSVVPMVILGRFCVDWGWALGLLCGLWFFFSRGGLAV